MFENTISLEKSKNAKPCPFCGNDEIVVDKYNHEVGERYRIWCTHCLAMIDPGYAQSVHAVEEKWNRRTQE